MGKLARIFSAVILALSSALATVTLLNSNAYAASSDFTVEAVEVTAKSDGVKAEISKLDNSTIQSNARFNRLDDSVKFQLTLKNATGYGLTIDSVSVANENEYIELSHDDLAGTELAAGDSFDFTLHAVYTSAIPSSNARNQSLNTKITISYTDERGNEETAEIIVTPNTGDGILSILGIFAASILALLAIIVFTRRKLAHGKLFGLVAAVAALGILLPSVASANDGLGEIQFTSNFEIYSKLHISVDDGTTVHEGDIDYGTTIGDLLDDADVPGYIFEGWKNEDGSDFDPNAPITGDVSIHPDLTPINYTIAIDTNGDGDTDVAIDATYDQDATLPTNEATKPGYTPNGWTDGTAHYADNDAVSNLTTENNSTVNLNPDFEPNHFVVLLDYEGDGEEDESIDVTYGAEVLLPANTAEKPGYTPNGWTNGANHYDDGTNLGTLLLDNDDEITLSPAWTRNTYIITIDPGEGTLPGGNEISGHYGDEVNLPTPTAPTGKKFTGWYDDEDNKLDSTITITDTTTVYAHYRDIATEAEWWNGSLNNMYMKELNANATTFKHYATDPQPDDVYSTEKYKVVSAPESPAKIYLWNDENDEDAINWWTEATTIRLHHQYAGDMFNGLSKLENIDLSGVDTSTATSFANFFNSTAIKTIDLSDWNTSSLTNMANMFSGCGQLKTVTFGSDFDTSKVTNMSGLFDDTTNLQSVDTENFDTEKVRNMAFMFRSSSIGTLDLSNFSTPALTNAQLMFSGATNLTTIYASADFDLSHVAGTDYHNLAYDYNMFLNTDSLAGGAGTAFSFSNPRDKTYARIDDPDNNKPGYFTKKNARYVRFNANGGEGSISSRYISTNSAESLPASGFSRSGYTFLGWSASRNSSMPTYADEQSIMAPEGDGILALYAIWGEGSWHKVAYTGLTDEELVSTENPIVFKDNYTTSNWIKLNNPTRKGYDFYWTGGTTTMASTAAYIHGTKDLNFVANFRPISYVVRYNKNGDNVKGNMSNQQFTYDEQERLNANAFTRDGYVFKGWARTASGSVKYTDRQKVLNLASTATTIDLYAVWEAE